MTKLYVLLKIFSQYLKYSHSILDNLHYITALLLLTTFMYKIKEIKFWHMKMKLIYKTSKLTMKILK